MTPPWCTWLPLRAKKCSALCRGHQPAAPALHLSAPLRDHRGGHTKVFSTMDDQVILDIKHWSGSPAAKSP